MASAAASSNYATTTATSTYHYRNDDGGPKFSEYRSRVMLGELPPDFLRVQFIQPVMHNPQAYGMRPGYQPMMHPQPYLNPNFIGFLTLTIAEARLVKNSSLLGLMKMDPYVTFRIGHFQGETNVASGGGKNPQWKQSFRINLLKGMETLHVEVYDQRNFTEDSFIGESEIPIPREVMLGETRQHWYPLLGRGGNTQENQGDILVVMSFTAMKPPNQPSATPVVNAEENAAASSSAAHSSNVNDTMQPTQHSPSAIPKPAAPAYSSDDIRTIEEMFPKTDRRVIINLLDQHGGNKDIVVNQLLQTMP